MSETKPVFFQTDIATPIDRFEFDAPANRRLRVTVYKAPPEPDREKAAKNPSFVLVEDVGPSSLK